MNKLIFSLIYCVLILLNQAQAKDLLLKNATILTAEKTGTISQASVLIKDGRIAAVGHDLSTPAGATVVDLTGKTISPGLIASDSLLGMVEISGGSDAAETGSKTSSISAGYDVQYVINPNSSAIPVARQGGITRAVIMPGTGNSAYGGQAAILSLNGDQNTGLLPQIGVVWELPITKAGRGAAFVQLKAELTDVRRYSKDKSALNNGELSARDWSLADLDALVPVVTGNKPLAVKADRASDIRALLQLAKQEKLKIILVGAAEGWTLAKDIAQAKVPVMLDPTDNLPGDFNALGASSDNAIKLHNAGVSLILRGGSSPHDAGKLRYIAGIAVANGLPYDVALKAVTVNPARVWGATGFGSIAVGQSADLAIWSGDPFEPQSELIALYIEGQPQSLYSRQNQLEEKYIKANDKTTASDLTNKGN